MPEKKKSKRRLRLGRLILLIFLIFLVVGTGAAAGLVVGIMRNLPTWDQEIDPNMTTLIYDAEGNVIARLHAEENRLPIKFNMIPDNIKIAFLATEDRDFYKHYGLNFKGIARAAIVDITTKSLSEGASTITQQLARIAYLKNRDKIWTRKLQEAVLAIQLERTFTKDEIFERYLNWVYFGEGAYGVQAAAKTFFNKEVGQLTIGESALLVGMVQSPGGRLSPFRNMEAAKARQGQVLSNMVEAGYITAEQAKKAHDEPLKIAEKAASVSPHDYPYYTDYVTTEAANMLEDAGIDARELYTGGFKIYTSMSQPIQKRMQEVYADPKNFPKGPKGSEDKLLESAMVIIDHRTGEIRGMVGGRDYTTQRGLNRAVQADRQPGSAIKPLVVYAPAIEKGFTPGTVIDDAAVSYPNTAGQPPYEPRDWYEGYRGLVTMREAIRWSMNIPAVKTLATIGIDTGFQFGKNLGLPLLNQDRNLSLALGGLTRGVSPLEMAGAFSAFANQGIWVEPHGVLKITDQKGAVVVQAKPSQKEVMKETTAYLITDLLQSVIENGTGSRAKLNRPAAGKTGSTQLPDNLAKMKLPGISNTWFVGYTPELVGAVYSGYDQTDAKHYLLNTVSGGSHPAVIWKLVMSEALKDVPVKPFPQPKGIVYAQIDTKSGKLPSPLTPKEYIANEVFVRGTVPTEVSTAWVEAQVCAETGQLPNAYCPDVITGVFLKRPAQLPGDQAPAVPQTGEQGGKEPEDKEPDDAKLEVPKEVCTIHGPFGENAGPVINVCTDPRHNGQLVLALIPRLGVTGGCPPLSVGTLALPPGQQAIGYCDLPEHRMQQLPAVSDPPVTAPDNGNPPGNTGDNDQNGAGPATTPVVGPVAGATPPPAPVLLGNLSRTSGSPSSLVVNLAWDMPQPVPGLIFSVERWVEDNPLRYNIALISNQQYADDKIEPNKVYHYRVYAVNPATNLNNPSNEIKIATMP